MTRRRSTSPVPSRRRAGAVADNLVLKAVSGAAPARDGLQGRALSSAKNIPVAGGLGGGSADAAAALRLLARVNDLPPGDARLPRRRSAVGADVPVCLDPRPRVMRGIGERALARRSICRSLPAVLVNPGVPLSTRDVFAGLSGRRRGKPRIFPPCRAMPRRTFDYLKVDGNDLTAAGDRARAGRRRGARRLSGLPGAALCAPCRARARPALPCLPRRRRPRQRRGACNPKTRNGGCKAPASAGNLKNTPIERNRCQYRALPVGRRAQGVL